MADGDLETIQTRHKKELKALTAQVTALKKTATKGDKVKRKEVLAEIEKLEKATRDRHDQELQGYERRDINNTGDQDIEPQKDISVEKSSMEEDTLPDAMDQLKLSGTLTPNGKPTGKAKPNRQKARLVASTYDLADPLDETSC